ELTLARNASPLGAEKFGGPLVPAKAFCWASEVTLRLVEFAKPPTITLPPAWSSLPPRWVAQTRLRPEGASLATNASPQANPLMPVTPAGPVKPCCAALELTGKFEDVVKPVT